MKITIAVLSTILTMMTFIYCIAICLFIKAIKKKWIIINQPKENKNVLIDELDEMYKNQMKSKKLAENQLNLALELCDETNKKVTKEEQV